MTKKQVIFHSIKEFYCLNRLKKLSDENRILEIKSIEPAEFHQAGLSKEKLTNLLKQLVRIRQFEDKVEELHLQRGLLIGAAHLYQGEEAIAVGVISALKPADWIISHHRGHGHAIAKGIPTKYIMAELFGKATGVCKGLGGSMHVSIYKERGGLYASAIVGSQIPIAVGAGLAVRYEKQNSMIACFFGDGATNTGAFHEGLNMASVFKVPVLFVCENNQFAMSTRISKSSAARSISERAAYAYNMPTLVVDGNDVLAVYNATLKAIEIIKKETPVFMECLTFRMKSHSIHRPVDETEEWKAWKERDPIITLQNKLLKARVVSEDDISTINQDVQEEIEEALKFAIESPTLTFAELEKLVYPRGQRL